MAPARSRAARAANASGERWTMRTRGPDAPVTRRASRAGNSSAAFSIAFWSLLRCLGRQPVAEDGALGVVGLVLEAAGQQPVAAELDGLAVQAGAGDRGEVRPRALDERARVGQAALVALVELAVLALGQREHRVADHADGALARRRRGSRRRTPPGRRRSGRPPARPRRRRTSSRPCRRPGGPARRRTPSTGCCDAVHDGVPQRVIGRTIPPRGSGPYGACSVSEDRSAMARS